MTALTTLTDVHVTVPMFRDITVKASPVLRRMHTMANVNRSLNLEETTSSDLSSNNGFVALPTKTFSSVRSLYTTDSDGNNTMSKTMGMPKVNINERHNERVGSVYPY